MRAGFSVAFPPRLLRAFRRCRSQSKPADGELLSSQSRASTTKGLPAHRRPRPLVAWSHAQFRSACGRRNEWPRALDPRAKVFLANAQSASATGLPSPQLSLGPCSEKPRRVCCARFCIHARPAGYGQFSHECSAYNTGSAHLYALGKHQTQKLAAIVHTVGTALNQLQLLLPAGSSLSPLTVFNKKAQNGSTRLKTK